LQKVLGIDTPLRMARLISAGSRPHISSTTSPLRRASASSGCTGPKRPRWIRITILAP
jgi:hypothetical protein